MSNQPAVVEIVVADEPDAWRSAGFTVTDEVAQIGAIAIRLIGRADAKRIRSWSWSDLPDGPPDTPPDTPTDKGSIDGLVTAAAPPSTVPPGAHANGSTIVDHVVVVTPNLERTTGAFAARGLDVRRVRDTDQYGAPFRQVFFRGGETIIELIGPVDPAPDDDRPAHFFGLAFTVANIDATAAGLGDGVGGLKDAVQPGRRIVTLHHDQYEISVPIAFMSAKRLLDW